MKVLSSLLAIVLSILAPTTPIAAQDKKVVGWVEKVRIYPGDLVIHAKLDTGAKHSSLNASHVIEFEHNGERWVRFDVTNRYGGKVTLERKVHRTVKIKRHFTKPQKRLAIMLGICLGSIYKEVEVNLAERTGFNYQILIGRSFIARKFIIDPSLTFTTKPNCKEAPRP